MRPVILTNDGSHTVYHPVIGSHYHSTHGAIQESRHVFIEAGLRQMPLNEISILEIGFGTGLNALLTFMEAEILKKSIGYSAVEAYPLEPEIIQKLNYLEQLEKGNLQQAFEKMHLTKPGEWESISKNCRLKILQQKLQDIEFEDKFNLVYFDAFGPGVQPEMWGADVFQKIFNAMEPNGLLTTYCAKGEVKRTLKKIGFTVESLPGPPGKREMVRASK
ncbi:MAG: tRNA (5-methylaminomethyl-2-thiouridine)(34)-methyltransferase MnmD [Bacteroidetes bacterium]|nr:tRNA (5-methylaminomethyl-2-thiouridine)(34)-methyltransferase MnmD [Bacteroidota bacterium]